MQELQVIDDKKINKIYEMITTDELTRESFEKDLIEATEKYKDYIPTASTLKDDKAKRAEFNKLIESKNRIRIDTKNLLSETANTWDSYAKSIIEPFATVVSEFDKGIKEIEEHQRQLKIDTVKSYIANKSAEYMLDPRLFDEKALEYVKAGDFMADGVTLKKATMKSLDDMVTFEFQKQQEFEKAKSAISGLCAEYGMTDSPYIRQLKDLTLAEVFEQIKADYEFEKQKEELRQAQERVERENQELLAAQQTKQQEQAPKSTETPNFDPETGKILNGGQIPQNEPNALKGAKNDLKRYTQKMTLEVYFVDTAEKDRFKAGLSQLGFDFKKNYQVSGYQRIEPLTQAELNEQCGVVSMSKQVKDILETHDTGCPHGITFAIHQNKEECIALFGRSGWPGLKPRFIRWNESVENQTTYKTEESLLNAYVCDVKKTSEDFIIIELLPF